MAFPVHKPLSEVKAQLVKDKFYLVHGMTREDDDPFWRSAWWDASGGYFYDAASGDYLSPGDLLVVPEPLPEVTA